MLRRFTVVCSLVCAAAARPAVAQQTASSPPLVIENVTVINVETGVRWPDHTVVVSANRISAVGPAATIASRTS